MGGFTPKLDGRSRVADVALVFEGLAAKLAANRLSESGRAELMTAFDALKTACEAGDRREAAKQDFNLHKTIVRLSGHRRLLEYYDMISMQIQRYIFSSDTLLRGDMESRGSTQTYRRGNH